METSVFEQYPTVNRVLRVYTRRAAPGDSIVFEILCRPEGGQSASAQPLRGLLTVPATAMKLPPASGYSLQPLLPQEIELPSYIWRAIVTGFKLDQPRPDPLWILTDRPTGLLAVVPWERILAPYSKSPILRLPHLPLKPFMPRRSLDIAVCIATSVTEESTVQATAAVLHALPRDLAPTLRLYVFGPATLLDALKPLAAGIPGIQFFAPARWESGQLPLPPLGVEISNPWLLWMLAQLREDMSFDCVQFISQCSEIDDQGRLAFASCENRGQSAAFRSNAREIAEFLDRAGSWCATFVSPPSNRSDAGLRLLVDQIAWLRPGPLCVFDLPPELDTEELTASNQFLLGSRPDFPLAAKTTVICHPAGFGATSSLAAAAGFLAASVPLVRSLLPTAWIFGGVAKAAADYRMREFLDRTTLASRLESAFQMEQSTPNRITSAQRLLERVLAQAADPLESEEVRTRAADAVTNAARLFSKTATQTNSFVSRVLNKVAEWRGQ